MKKIELKVRKVKTTEADGKPDTYTVLLEGSAAPGVEFALTVSAEDIDELQTFVSTRPGALMEVTLAPAMYGNIESYGHTEVKTNVHLQEFEILPTEDDMREALAMQADPYKDPREETQKENLDLRRRAYEASQQAEPGE